MTQVNLQDVRAFYGSMEVLKGVSFQLEESEFAAILGPSGCGKTTLLRVIAGFIEYQGQVLFDGVSCDRLPAHKRDIGIVFQDYALFPHMTVRRNIEYGLRLRKQSGSRLTKQSDELIGLLQLDSLADRYPGELSGGQRQRVAIARALAIRPRILLLDEPLSALDKKLREDMQVELRKLQKQVGITTMFVTHDQEEALALSDRIVVMDDGEIRQIGSPNEIYSRPADRFVADFIGKSNILPVSGVASRNGQLACKILQDQPVRVAMNGSAKPEGDLCLSIRPERLSLKPARASKASFNTLSGVIDHVVYLGAHQLVRLTIAEGVTLDIDTGSDAVWKIGDRACVQWKPEDGILLQC